MIFFAANQFNFGGNMVSYVLYDGDLYRIFIGNENTGTAQLVSKYLSTSMGAAILKKGEQDRQRDQQLLVHDSYLHTQLNKNDCWKILEAEDIVSKKDCYRIRCLIEKGRSRKKCRKSLYIRPGYNNYDQLIRCAGMHLLWRQTRCRIKKDQALPGQYLRALDTRRKSPFSSKR